MDLRVAGQVAVVTGASKGIGLAIVRGLLEEGMRVVAASRRPSEGLEALESAELVHVPVDLMDAGAADAVVARAVEAFGGVDVLVNNAGGAPPGTVLPRFGFDAVNDAGWRDMFEFNVLSVVRFVRAAIPEMLRRGGGSIVTVSSVNGRHPTAMNVDYNAAKAAVSNLTKALSEEYAPQGIRVNTVSPGPVRTAWWTDEGGAADVLAARFGADRVAVMDKLVPEMMHLTTGRLADPREVADAVALLASPRSASTTGAEYVVDSGFLKET